MQYSVKLVVAALFALSSAAHPTLRESALAQVAQAPAFSLPETVPSGTTLSIQSSPNLGHAADALKQEFEATYDGTEVGVDLIAQAPAAPAESDLTESDNNGGFAWWWLLLPLMALGGLAWALGRSRREMAPGAGERAIAPPAPEHPLPPTVEPAGVLPVVDPEPTVAAVPPAPELAPEPVVVPPVVDPEPAAAAVPPAPELAPEPVVVPPVVDPEPAPPAPELAPEPAGVLPVVDPEPEPPAPELAPEPVVVPPVVEPAPEIITVEEVPPAPEPVVAPPVPKPAVVPSAIPAVLGITGLAGAAADSLRSTEDQAAVEASKFNVVGRPTDGDLDLSTIDDGLPPLPDGYGESRIVLMPRDPHWAYAYWDTPHTYKEELRRQGGEQLALRLYDVTGINLDDQAPHSLQQVGCDEMAREWYMQIPVSDRDYQVEIGYLAGDGRWLVLARSNTVRVPPVYPSDWTEEHFLAVTWQENLHGKTIVTLVNPSTTGADAGLHEQLYALAQGGEALRVDGSLFGSMQPLSGSMAPPISSFIFASGAGLGAAAMVPRPTMSGVSGFTLSGFPGPAAEFPGLTMSGVSGLTMSGFSGLTMSGVGLGIRPRKFWLVADAELIVYGATEPDASVTVAGVPIELSEDGTFRFHQSFQDGTIDYPIMAVAADGEQSRNIHMTFERQTPDRRTNTKDEAKDEWPSV